MGHDVDPGATRRAWMSLMGPLPGIVIGWALMLVHVTGVLAQPWVLPLATVFLLINYLNVLPVPPLDGAHVLEALLPVRWARLQTILTGALAILGGLVAAWFSLYLLTFLAFLQLPALLTRWRLHRVEDALSTQESLRQLPRGERIERGLLAFESRLGPSADAKTRVSQARQVLHRIDLEPMSLAARVPTAFVYAALLFVPIVGVVTFAGLRLPTVDAAAPTAEDMRRLHEQQAANKALHAEAAAMPLPTLLAALNRSPLPAPASAAAVAAAEARLGQPLPADLRAFFAITNGLPGADLRPIEDIAAPAAETIEMLGYGEGKLYLDLGPDTLATLAVSDANQWWQIGGDDEAPLFYLPKPHAQLPGIQMVSAWMEAPSAHRDLRGYLDMRWVEMRQAQALEARYAAATARATAKLGDAPADALLSSWQEPGFMLRWINPKVAWRGPVDDDDLREAAERVGAPLPDELVAVLRKHDGFQPLQLLPAASIRPWREFVATIDPRIRRDWFSGDYAQNAPFAAGTSLPMTDENLLAHCFVVAGSTGDAAHYAPAIPALLWCPDGRPAAWVDPLHARGFAALRDWMLPRAAHMRSAEEM
jgi:hypothetical protein